MASGDKEAFPVAGVIQSSSRIIISQQSPSPSPGASKPQSYKVFVLPPSQLNSLGLVAKNENGRVILTERAIESTVSHNAAPNSNAAMSLAFIKTPEGIQIQSGQSSSSVKTTPKRGYVASAEVVKGAARELQVHRPVTKISTPGTNALGASSSRPMFARRSSSRRLLPQFTNYWKSSLVEKGYIRCPLRDCNYICLNFGEMTIHYYQCKGEPFASKYICTPCNGRLKSEEDLKSHYIETHSREGRIARKPPPKKVVELPKPEEKAQVWIRKRAYSKVHKISWNIALEEKGYVNCFFKNCCFMALDLNQMIKHYGICNGTTAATSVECPYCEACAECMEKLEAHVKKAHSANPNISQVVNPEVNIAVSVSDSLPVPVPQTNIASAVSSGINIGSSFVHQEEETVILSKKQSRLTSIKISAPTDKTVHSVVSMTEKLPKSLDQSHSRLSSDTISKTSGSLSSSADTEVHCLFSMYEDFDEQRSVEREILDSHLGSVGLSIKKECENTSTVLCKTYSKDNQRLVRDETYNERISSPLSALPCSFSDNISLCTDLSDIQIMRSSMSEGANNVMLVETKPEACAVEKLHEYMSHCDSNILNEENVSYCGTSLNSKEQKEVSPKSSASQISNPVSQESNAPHYELFKDDEPEYPQEYSLNSSINKTVKSNDINLSQNDLEEDKQVTVEECLFAESYASNSLVSYTEDVEEYIIPEIVEMTQYLVESPVEVCSKAVNKRNQAPNEKQKIASSQVPTNKIENLVPAKSNVSNVCKNIENTNNNTAKANIDTPRSIHPVDSVKCTEPQAYNTLQKKVHSDIQVISQDNSSAVETSFTNIQPSHPLYADPDDLQNLDVPILASVSVSKDNSVPNSQFIDVHHTESDLSEVSQELYLKKSVSGSLIISDTDKLTNSVKSENIEVLEKKNLTEAESADTANGQFVPDDLCNARLICEVNIKSENNVNLDVALNDNVLENVTEDSSARNPLSEISSIDISEEGINNSLEQLSLKQKKNLPEIAINLPESAMSDPDSRDVKEKENALKVEHSSLKTLPQVHSIVQVVCSSGVQGETKTSEVLVDELQEPVQETTIQTASHTNASNILQLSLNNSVLKDEQDESIYTDVECRIDEFQNESNQTLRSYDSILPSHNLNQDTQTSSENISVDNVLDKTLRPATKVPKISHSTKEGICVVANANLKENSSQIKEQSLKSVSSEAAGEFSHFCEMKNTDCNSVSLGVSVLGDIQLHLDTNEKEIVRINTSHCEGLSYENESKSTKLTDLDSDVSSISVLKEEIELKIEENKSSNVELSDAKHSVPVVVSVEEFESNMKANEAKLSSVSFTDIEVERKDDHLHLDNIFSETCVSKDIPVSSQGGLMSTISETNAVISANSDVETAIKTLPDNKICHSLGNLPKEIEGASAEDNMLESSSMAVNDLIVCTEQKYDNVKESISQGKDVTLEIEKEDMNINNSKISGVFPSSQCLKSEDSSNIVSASIKEVNVEKLTNIENDERSDVISQILEQSDTLVDKNQEIDSNNLKMLDGELITTVAENVQEVNQLCPPSEASDSYNKVNVFPITVPLISVTLEADNQLDEKVNVVECSSSMEYVSKTTEGTSCNEKFPQNELPSKGMLASKEDIRENETQLVSEVIPQTQNVLQISDCVTPFVEELGPISNKTNTDFPSTEEMNEKRVKKESENENNSINDYNALHVHLSTVSETNVDESNVEIMVEPLPEGKECDLLRSLPRKIGNTYDVKPSHEDNQLDSAEINDNTLESSAANDWIACLEQKSDGVEESFLEHKSDTFKVKNDVVSTSNTEVIKLLPDSQSPLLKDPSQIVSSIKEINVDEKANIKNDERSVGRSQVLEHSDILENKSQEAATSNLKMLDDDLIVLDNAQDINRLYPPCEVTDSIDKMKPNTSKLISGSLEYGRQSIAEIESNECTSLSDVSKATEEKNSQIEIVSEGGPLIQGITDSKKDTRENETQLMYKISPETQNTLQISEYVTRLMEDLPVSNREIHECSSEEQMDVKIVREETEDEKISISVDDASCSHLNTDSESNKLIAEKSNVAISVKPLCDDKKSDSLGSLSKEINNTFNVMPSNEDNQLETSRMAISNLSQCSEQKYDKESSLEKDTTFKMVNKDVSTNSSKISGVLLDSHTSISEDPSKIVSASVKEVNIDKTTKIENVERSFVVSHAEVDSVTPHGNNQEADSNNMKILDGDLITTVADDVQEVNKLYSPTELPDSINKMDVLPPKIPLISGSFESDNQSNEDVGLVESLSLSDISQATEEKNCQIENVSERGLFPKVIPDSKDIGENVTSLVHEESSKTQNALEASESVTPFVEDTKPETSREIHDFFPEEQMGVKIVTEESKDEKISVIVDGASCLNMNITSESNELVTEKNNIVKTLKPLCDDKESDLPEEVNNTLNVMSSDENNHLELSRMAVNDLSPCSEQKYDIAKESLLEIKDMSTNSSKISGVLSDSQTAITEDPSRIVSSSIKEINIDRMANIKNVEKSVSVSQVIMDYGTPQEDNQEADSNLKTLDGDLTTTVADDVQKINELYYSSSEFTDSINKVDVLPTTVPLVSGSLELDSHSNAQVDAVECTSLSNETKTTEEFYSSIENIPESGLILKQMSDSKKDIKENETQLCEESSETQTALQVSECVTPCVEDIVSVSNKKIQEFENTEVVTTSTDITEEQMEVKFGTEKLVDEKILISDDEVSLMTNIGKVKSETLLSCVSEKTQEEGKASTSTDICSEVKIIENDAGFQDLTVDRESSEAKLIQETKSTEKEVCVVKGITDAERTVSSMKDNFLSAPDEECILMSCQKQDNVNIVVPSLLPLKKTNDTMLSLTESSISEEPSIASECSLTGSPKIFQELGESCGYEKHLKPTSEALQSITEENKSSISEDIQEEAKEPSVLSCNVSIVADTKNITGFDFNAKSNVLEYIKDQEEVLNAKAGRDKEIQEIIETKNENKLSDSLVPLTEKSEQTKETTSGTEFSGTSLLETRTLLGREPNVLGGMSEQFINSPTSNEASLFSETTITLSENVKPLSLENLSIALAGEMEDSPEHVSSHEMLGVDSYSNKARSDSKKLLIPRDAFSKTFENYALDSPKAVSESDEKIYSTQDLQQILEGSDDSKHKLEDEETFSSTVPSENVLCSNESKDMLKREENDPSPLHNMNEIVSSSDSVKVIEKTFETELTEINLSRDKDSSWRKRRHSTDFSIKMEMDGECANYCSPVKRKRSSSFCCDLTTNYEKNGKLHLLKSTLIKETIKSNEQLEKLESNANLSTSYSDITESCGPTDTQDFGEVTNQNKLSNEEGIVHTKGTSVTNSNLHKDPESKCMFHASEDSVSNTNIYEQNRKINEAIHLPLETNNVQVDAVTVTCLEEKNRCTPENKTDLVCTEPPRLRRKRSIETREEEAEVKRKSRRQSLRNKTIVSEDSNSSNSSVNSASDIAGGRKTRRGRKSRKVDDSVNTNVNSVSNTPQKENSEGTTLKQTKTGESETQQILPYDSEQSIMSEDSVFSKIDSQNEFDSSLEVDDSASSTVGSIISDDSKDWAEDSQIGIDQESDMSEIGTNCQGQGKGGGRGQSRRRNYRRGSKRRVHWRRRGVQKVGGREEEEESQGSSLPVDSGNSCAQEELMESNEIEQRREDPNEEIQCGKCKEKMKRKSYDRHNASIHNGLSWLEGEPPFDISNEKLVLSTLWKVVKTRRFLTCENCGESKKSAVGFWSHIAFCQRTAEEREALKVMCDICGRYMIPASLKVHLQMHRAEPKPDPCIKVETTRTQRAAAAKATSLLQEVMKEETQGEDKKVVRGSEEMVDLYQRLGPVKPSNSTLAKWKRLVAAEQQLECHFPGCTFKSADLEVMIQHFGKCEKCPRRVYSCDLCDFQCKNEKEMQLHLTKEHFGNLEESDPDDPKSLKKMQSKLSNWKVCNKLLFLGREMSGTANGDRPFLPAVKWTLKFMQENYAKEDIFPDYHTTTKDWIPVPESEYSQYLPQTTESISFSTLAMREEVVSTDSVTFNWRRMKIFESDIIDGVPTLFTGGPIWALAWATNPVTAVENETRDQFLAISCHQQMGDTYKSNERYVGKGLIQLWNFGPLDNLQRSTSNPKFALGIAHEYGSVWDLEWCPSGCYETTSTNEHLQRLGLLAAACSDGCVHIFSVCFPNSLANDARYPIFRCKPVMTLTASENLTCELGGLPWSCLRLSWYKGKDHSVVAGGFNNGMVSLWNIRTESLLLRKQEDGTNILLPYKSFQAHLSCVTALSLSSQDEGRYLMTGSKDTTIKVWDMEDSSGPIPPVVRKGMVTDGIWLTHWLSSITSFDDVYSMGHCNTTLNPPRGYGFKLFPLLPQNSVTWSLSTTDWVNGIAQSTHAGELTVIFPHQLFLNVDTEKGNKDKRLILSYVELKDIVNETEKHKCESSCSVPCKKQQLGDLQKEIESNKSKNPSEYEKVMFQLEEKDESEKGGLSFVIERNPRKGKKCVITPLSEQICDSTSVSDSSFANDNVNEGSDSLENIECISMLNQHEKRLLFTFKKDLERLNVTSRLKVTFPYYNNEKKKSNSNDTVKEFLMIVGSVNDDIKTENCSQESSGSAKAVQDDDSMFTIPSDDYEAVESKFGMIFCDFPANNLSTIPAASRLWTRKSETMKTAPVEIYPVTSLNKVKWNPNCRSFLWLAAGYQCGLLRVPCISGMHNKEVEQLLRHTTWQKV